MMNRKITIIGCNSILYKTIKPKLYNFNINELSHKDLNSVDDF